MLESGIMETRMRATYFRGDFSSVKKFHCGASKINAIMGARYVMKCDKGRFEFEAV
jgi:hypothetical protein